MALAAVKECLPWWGKVLAKIILSRIPAKYTIWQKFGLFRHGNMDKSTYALGVFNSHVERARLTKKLEGKTVLEIGPGDSVSSSVVSCAYGARAILVDVGRYAVNNTAPYIKLAGLLRSKGLDVPDFSRLSSLESLLDLCHGKYLVNGLVSLKSIPDSSVDFIFSQAVLEHVRKNEFSDTMRECARILKPSGICSHRIDLRDHLGGGLNNLRFSENLWESKFFVRSGFYTNRIQYQAMLDIFEQSGFEVEVKNVNRWQVLPIKRSKLALEFSEVSDSDLCVSVFDVLLSTNNV